MREFQFTKRDDANVQMSVMVDIIDPQTQLFTIMDIRGGKNNVCYFSKYFPWNIGAVLHRSDIEGWYKNFSDMFIGMEYGDVNGAKNMDGGGGGKPNFWLFPSFMSEGVETPVYVFDGNIIIEGCVFQYHSETGEDVPDVSKVKINNNTYNVQFIEDIHHELEPGVFYIQGFSMEITPEFIEHLASLGINIDLNNGNYICYTSGEYISDEIHGDLTATFYDSNGNGSSIVIKEYVKPVEEPDYLCFTAEKAGATLRMMGEYSEGHENDFALEYSTDGETWQNLNFTSSDGASISDTLIFENIGDKVYFRGDNVKGTTDMNLMLQNEGYSFRFYGGEGTNWRDNEFSLSGDLQTIVDKTGQNKTAGCFWGLFARSASDEGAYISVTTPPNCSATSLSSFCFYYLFGSQTTLLAPMDISNIGVDTNNADSFISMYDRCEFNMTSDNGVTLNGFGNIEYPITINIIGSEISANNNFEFADEVLGNTNGFEIAELHREMTLGGKVIVNDKYDYYDIHTWYFWIQTNESVVNVKLEAIPDSGYHFVKWQTSNDEGSTWTDIPDATNSTYIVTLTQAGNYYYKAIFEQD